MKTISNELLQVAQKIDQNVFNVLGMDSNGFTKAFAISQAITEIKAMLVPEYMKPIMQLQGNKLGFKTDMDKKGGYPMDVVRNCLIEAILLGLQPYNNQFNIIAGNMYPTKEGLGFLLNNFKGLEYSIVCGLPKVNSEKTSASVEVEISWEIKGNSNKKVIPIAIKMDSYTGVDAIIGKATRKARAWLLSNITGMEITDGDVSDVESLNKPQKTLALQPVEVAPIEVKVTEDFKKKLNNGELPFA